MKYETAFYLAAITGVVGYQAWTNGWIYAAVWSALILLVFGALELVGRFVRDADRGRAARRGRSK